MEHELVIFDCDGVLVDSERLTVAVEARVLADLGWPLSPEEVARRFVGRSAAEALAEISDHLGAEATQLFAERSTAEVYAAFDRELTAVPRVQGVLDWLHARGVSTCVASSGTHSKLRKTLGLTGLYGRFDGNIYSVLDVAHGKPAPDLFLYAASQMGVRPERCAVIEDSRYGVQAAVSAGMTAFGFAGGLADASVLAGAGALVFS